MQFDVEYEDDVLAHGLKDSTFLRSAVPILDAHQLQTAHHQWIWKVMRETWMSFGERVSSNLLRTRLQHEFKKDDERRPYLELAVRLYQRKPAHASASLDALRQFVRFVNIQTSLEEAARALGKGDLDRAAAGLRAATFKDVRPRSYTDIRWLEEFDARQAERKHLKEHPEERVLIPTGIKRLDAVVDGIQLGEVGLVVGTTGRGKSVMLTNLGYHAIKHSWGVAHFSLEMPGRQVAMRYDSRFIGLPYKKFKNYDFTPGELREIDTRLGKMKSRLEGKLRIVSMPVRSVDIVTLRQALEDVRAEMDVKLVIVDSGDHMIGTTKYTDLRIEQASIYWDLKRLAEEESCAVWSSTQAGKEWAEKTASAESVSESYDKARIADMVITLNSPKKSSSKRTTVEVEDDDEPGVKRVKPVEPVVNAQQSLELYLAKYRDGESKVHIPLATDFSRMLIEEAEEIEREAA